MSTLANNECHCKLICLFYSADMPAAFLHLHYNWMLIKSFFSLHSTEQWLHEWISWLQWNFGWGTAVTRDCSCWLCYVMYAALLKNIFLLCPIFYSSVPMLCYHICTFMGKYTNKVQIANPCLLKCTLH